MLDLTPSAMPLASDLFLDHTETSWTEQRKTAENQYSENEYSEKEREKRKGGVEGLSEPRDEKYRRLTPSRFTPYRH